MKKSRNGKGSATDDKNLRSSCRKQYWCFGDAEETWIQDPVDAFTMQMMERYNKTKVVVYNTIQLYRHDRFNF